MTTANVLFLTAAVLIVPAAACGGIGVWETVKQTFRPMSLRQFLLPPCPLCWAIRGLVTAGLVILFFR